MRVTLRNYTPIERLDGTPWVTALIYEATDAVGTGASLLVTITLDPVDSDPANPITRDFTVTTATLQNGWYSVVWEDEAETQSPTPYVQNVAIDRAWRPLVSDVAALLRGRTVNRNTTDLGTFTADTKPTYEQVDSAIDAAVLDLDSTFGPNMAAVLVGTAQNVVALYVAANIELSYFGEQVVAGRSAYDRMFARYQDAMTRWRLARKELGADGIPDTPDDTSAAGMPAYSFPILNDPFSSGTRFGGYIW